MDNISSPIIFNYSISVLSVKILVHILILHLMLLLHHKKLRIHIIEHPLFKHLNILEFLVHLLVQRINVKLLFFIEFLFFFKKHFFLLNYLNLLIIGLLFFTDLGFIILILMNFSLLLISGQLIIFIIGNHLENGGLWNELTTYINKISLNLLSTSTLNCSIRSTVTTSPLTCKFSLNYSTEFMLFI